MYNITAIDQPSLKPNNSSLQKFLFNLSEQNIIQIANSDIKIILGDLNQKLVKKTFTNPLLEMKVDVMKPTTTE